MHVAIDLGEINTHLACWEKGKLLADACIMLRIPGLGRFDKDSSNISWSKDNLQSYFSKLYREYLLPSRLILDSIAVSVPMIFSLSSRRTLLEVIEETLGLPDAIIVPNPIAITAGYQLRNPQLPLAGDIIIIESYDSYYGFSLLSETETSGITLEKQFTGRVVDLLSEAEKAGFYSNGEWNFNCLLLRGNSRHDPEIKEFIASLPSSINIISGPDMAFAAIEGLSVSHPQRETGTVVMRSVIYPFTFHIEKYDRNQKLYSLERLPFDTANLELECGSRYSLITLDSSSPYNLAGDDMHNHFRIYESTIADECDDLELSSRADLILEINAPQSDLPGRLEVFLDMAAASLNIYLERNHTVEMTASQYDYKSQLRTDHTKLYKLIKANGLNHQLVKDFQSYQSSKGEGQQSLTFQLESTLFHLYALLQIWHRK